MDATVDTEVGALRYAVVDLAVATDLRKPMLRLHRSKALTLFARDGPRAVLEVGPWLVDLSKVNEFDAALSAMGGRVPWGYYLWSSADLAALRRSLRRFNLAKVGPRELLFRYWDPRVLGAFLDIADEGQRKRFLAPIKRLQAPTGHFDISNDA